MSAPALEAAIRAALDTVGDPCMCMAGKGLSIVDMGLVTDLRIDGGAVEVDLLLTDPNCLFEFRISDGVQRAVAAVAGVETVRVSVGCYPIWTEDRLSQRAQDSFAEDRARLMAGLPSSAPAPAPG